ncbi:MAG: RNA polymerase sigma factor [Neoaquamicrobium sediminum]|uniref:RNA polymerase sigma factor n=1 Tax=Neoaquamicrobium sediminum TaxID=1849104 RepID=UPI004035D90A
MALTMDEEDVSDGELVRRAAAGDRSSFARLVKRHYAFVFRIAYRMTGHRADAEDIAQDVCARLGRAIRTYRCGSAFTTWLYPVVVNAVRDQGRSAAREATRRRAYGIQARIESAAYEANEPAEALWEAVRDLPPKQQEAVTLVYGEALSHAEAADLLGCSETTVSWHIHEAKKRLKLIMSAGEV